jgi:hypothetical protein
MYDGVPTTAPAAVSPVCRGSGAAGVGQGGVGRSRAGAQILGQSPVDDDRLAERDDQDVRRLEIASGTIP